jgi:hypothetical protein
LICPPTWVPVSRLLIVNPTGKASDSFFSMAARICRQVPAAPVVLTVAATEREARERQDRAADVLRSHELSPTFDRVTGCDVRTAVSVEARLRRCSVVLMESDAVPRRTWWLARQKPIQLATAADSPAFLTLGEECLSTADPASATRQHAFDSCH